MADAIGRKPSTVCDYMKGRIRPSYPIAKKLAAETGTHVLFWLDREHYDEKGIPRTVAMEDGPAVSFKPPPDAA